MPGKKTIRYRIFFKNVDGGKVKRELHCVGEVWDLWNGGTHGTPDLFESGKQIF